MKKFLIILLFLGGNTIFAQDVASIIAKTEAVYSSLPVYLDSGKVVTSFYNNELPGSSAMIFNTAYKKTGEFNFEFRQMGNDRLHIVNRSRDGKVSVWNGSAVNTDRTFNLALAGATGISSNAVGTITDLLIPGVRRANSRNIFYTITDTELESSETVSGRPCFKLKGKNRMGDGYTAIWISKNDHMIRKVESDRAVQEFRVRQVYTFIPYTLQKENPALFTFQPGKKIQL